MFTTPDYRRAVFGKSVYDRLRRRLLLFLKSALEPLHELGLAEDDSVNFTAKLHSFGEGRIGLHVASATQKECSDGRAEG